MPRLKFSVSNVLMALGFLLLGVYLSPAREPEVITRVDSVPPAAFADSLDALSLEVGGLRALVDGRHALEPRTILRTDTLVTPPDTVLQLVALRGSTLSVAPLIHTDSLWAPELHRFDVGSCDDGWSWNAGTLVCDRARFGHLYLFAEAGATYSPFDATPSLGAYASAGLYWKPSYRSGWRVSTGLATDGRATLAVAREWNAW